MKFDHVTTTYALCSECENLVVEACHSAEWANWATYNLKKDERSVCGLQVYKAKLGRVQDVAVKEIRRELDPDERRRLQQHLFGEIALLRRCRHRNIVTFKGISYKASLALFPPANLLIKRPALYSGTLHGTRASTAVQCVDMT